MNVTIDIAKTIGEIRDEFLALMSSDTRFSGYSVVVEDERVFAERRKNSLQGKTIYIVVSFYSATANFGACIMQGNLRCVSEANSFTVARNLLFSLLSNYNLTKTSSGTNQIYQTPQIEEQFVEVYNGFYATMSMPFSFIMPSDELDDVVSLEMEVDGEMANIPVLAFVETYQNNLVPQPTPEGGGFAHSVSSFAVYTFTVSTYDMDPLRSAVDEPMYSEEKENLDFVFTLKKKSGTKFEKRSFKLASVNRNVRLGELIALQATFTY